MQGGEEAFLSGQNFFQVKGCPYAIPYPQALEIYRDNKKPGNTIKLVEHGIGKRLTCKLFDETLFCGPRSLCIATKWRK